MSEDGKIQLVADASEAGLPMDRLLLRHQPDMTRNKIRAMLAHGRLRINGSSPTGPAVTLAAGDVVEILPANTEGATLIFEDASFIVFYKPAGMDAVSALRAVTFSHSQFHRRLSPRLVLQMDERISGVAIAASHPGLYRQLTASFSGGGGNVRYRALVEPAPDASLGAMSGGWSYRVERRFQGYALLGLLPPASSRARPLQALQFAHFKPLVLPGTGAVRLAVHAASISLPHPRTGRYLNFNPPLPRGFREAMEGLTPLTILAADLPAEPPHSSLPDTKPEGPEKALRSPNVPRRRRPRSGR